MVVVNGPAVLAVTVQKRIAPQMLHFPKLKVAQVVVAMIQVYMVMAVVVHQLLDEAITMTVITEIVLIILHQAGEELFILIILVVLQVTNLPIQAPVIMVKGVEALKGVVALVVADNMAVAVAVPSVVLQAVAVPVM